ncbi:MAG: DUF58 domain-containing protein [Acetobacteraceae bacterium]
MADAFAYRPEATRRAEALAARLPALLVAAERVAATVAQGVHGRRRSGRGDSFWQFRHFVTGDAPARIDWRRSARSGRPAAAGWFVRETEWEAAQTVCLWRDGSASMDWRSPRVSSTKRDRAELLLLALAALLLRGGERAALIAEPFRPMAGRAGLNALAAILATEAVSGQGLPPMVALPRHAKIVLISDFLTDITDVQALISRLAGLPATGYLLQVLDPAETLLPYEGRVRFTGLEREPATLVPRVEAVRDAYAGRLAAMQDSLLALCRAAGFGFGVHRTDHPPETALLGLYTALSSR